MNLPSPLIRVVLNYAVDEELIEANPAARIKLRRETPRDRYLSEAEIRSVWGGLENTATDPQIARILKLLLVTGQRRSEVVDKMAAAYILQGALDFLSQAAADSTGISDNPDTTDDSA